MKEKIEWYGTIPSDCDWLSFANQTDLGYEYDTTFHKITATTDDNQFKPYDDIKFVVDYNTSSASRTAKVKFEQKEGAIDYCYISQNGTEFEQIWKHYSKSNDAIVNGSSNKTANNFEVAVGNYNSTRKGLLFSVGNGTSKNRSNSFDVDNEKAKANRIETAVLSATSISADTLVLKDNSLADIDVDYEPTVTKDTPNNYVIGKIRLKGKENTIYGIDTKFDSEKLKNLSVGSVNLVYNSSFIKDDNDNVSYWGTYGNPTNVTVSKQDDGWDWVTIRSKDDGAFWQSAQRRYEGVQSCNDLKPDTYYTCSFYAYGDSESEKHDVLIHFVDKNKMNNNLGQVCASNKIGNLIEYKSWKVEDGKLCIPITQTKTRYWFTFKTPKNNDIGFFNIMLGFWGATEEKEVHFSRPQLEEGNMCTDWKESGVYYEKEMSSKIEQRASSITTSVDDKLNKMSSKIEQTASSVKLSVENEINGKLNQTGIDIQNGSITLNVDNTNIIGNLSLHASQNNGLVVFDESGNTRVSLQPREIGRMSDNNMSTYDYLFKMTYFDVNNDTSFNKAIPRYNVKGAVANDKIQITEAYIDINYIKGNTNYWTQPPQSIRYEYRIYSDSAVVDTENGTATLETIGHRHIYSIKNLDYTVKNDGDYSVEVYVSATIPSGTTQVELRLNGYIIKAVPSLTFIGQDGYYSTQGIYKKIWFGKDGFELIWADDKAAANGLYDGLKLDDNGLQRLALFATISDGSVVKNYAPISSFRRIKMLTKADFLDAYSCTLKRTIKAYTVKPTDETVIITDCLSGYFVILPNNVVDGRLVELKNVTDQTPSILLEKGYEGAAQPYLMDFRRGNDHIRDMGNRVWQLKACTLYNIIGDGEMRGYTQWMVWND